MSHLEAAHIQICGHLLTSENQKGSCLVKRLVLLVN